ncbi:DUF7285 family protein [Halorientalis halophila]|uniref:DUF7285 family protein n=1 Tax=Halorientalis halophila TaxID=3108499 RepID=UPI003009B81F
MSRSSACRGQVEPIAAIVAVFAVGVGLTIYTGAVQDALPGTQPRNVAQPTLSAVEDHISEAGVIDPERLRESTEHAPDGRTLNATLRVGDRRWAIGPRPPESARQASTRASVRLRPGTIRPGRLTVRVW